MAQNTSRSGGQAIYVCTARRQGYAQSINARKRIEQVFGWIQLAAEPRQLKARGRTKVVALFRLHVACLHPDLDRQFPQSPTLIWLGPMKRGISTSD